MKLTLLALLIGVTSTALAANAASPMYPPHVISNSELRVLPRSQNGRTYQLHIHLPGSYANETSRRYPVLYVTDGYWDFPTIVTSYDNLAYDRVVPEFIVVGLGYAGENLDYGTLRNWELSPVANGNDREGSGHAAEFLGLIESEIIPFVDREYRVDPAHRVLAGSSLGGSFAVYAMLTKPTLFEGYIAVSPAVRGGNDWLLGYEESFAKSRRPLHVRLFMTGAENESRSFLASIKRFDERLKARHYDGFTYSFRIIDGERHAGTKAEGYVRGMRFVFAALAPETGPSSD